MIYFIYSYIIALIHYATYCYRIFMGVNWIMWTNKCIREQSFRISNRVWKWHFVPCDISKGSEKNGVDIFFTLGVTFDKTCEGLGGGVALFHSTISKCFITTKYGLLCHILSLDRGFPAGIKCPLPIKPHFVRNQEHRELNVHMDYWTRVEQPLAHYFINILH